MLLLLHVLSLIATAGLLLYPFLQHLFGQPKAGSKLPPGSFGWLPLIGQTLSFVSPHFSFSRGRFLDHNIKRYGKIFRAHLFGHPTVVSCDVEFNNFVLQNEERLFETSYPKNIPAVLGDLTMLVVTGDAHKRIRGVALGFFASVKSHGSSFLTDIDRIVVHVMSSWKNKDTVIFCNETRYFTFSVIVKKVLSISPEDPLAAALLNSYKTFMQGLVSFPLNLPGTSFSRAIQARSKIKKIVTKICEERKRRDKHGESSEAIDFLDALLSHDGLSEDEIFSLVMDMLIGGYETTAMLIAIIVKFVGEDLNMLSELREEHEAAEARKKVKDEPLEWDDYKDMQFTQSLIHEALRIGNVVKFVHRKTLKPIEYKGYEIPAGWKVLPIFTGVHLDPSLHPDPLHFNPRRWPVKNEEATGNMKNFMAFGGGKRLCPGSDLARLETCIFLHHLVLKYSWKPVMKEDWPISFPYIDFANGLHLAIKPLHAA